MPLHFCTIYRNGQAHNNILCLALVDSNMSDSEIVQRVRSYADKDRYSDFKFISQKDVSMFKPLSKEQIENDSCHALWGCAETFEENTAVMYFAKSVISAINYYQKISDGKKWYE